MESSNGTEGADQGLLGEVPALDRWEASRPQPGDRLLYLGYGIRPEPIPAFRGPVEGPFEDRIGICCSGGGIRSAAFNLGALQTLQRAGELEQATYLSAVSGGSYIAAAFSMVAKARDGEQAAGREGDPDGSDPDLLDEEPPFAPGSPEEQYLRNRSSYLAPDGTSKLYLAYRLVLGLLINVVFLAVPVFAATMLLGVWIYRPLLPDLAGKCGGHCAVDLPASFWILPLALVALAIVFGAPLLLRRPKTDRRRRLLEVWPTRLLIAAAVIAFLLVALPELVGVARSTKDLRSSQTGASEAPTGAVGGGGLTVLLVGVIALVREAFATPKKALHTLGRGQKALRKLSSRLRLALAYFAGAVVGPALFVLLMVFALSLTLARSTGSTAYIWLTLIGVAALAGWAIVYHFADLTAWSLHPFYKRRLCTAFALKRVKPTDEAEDPHLWARQVIEQEQRSGIAVERDYDRLVKLSETALTGQHWPTLIVCAAANVSDPGATPPGRHVTSFTFSANAAGGPLVGAMSTEKYERRGKTLSERRPRDLTLPAAVAMSGAAISPSMGKLTRKPFTFLMALANLRLGVWVPNPRWIRGTEESERGRWDRPRPWYLLMELLGRNRIDARYLYVTDGGHYENLGLVELLRRGCTKVYCFDCSGGEGFGELGDAIALARSELEVEIDIDPAPLTPKGEEDIAEANVVVGRFRYNDEDKTEGTLVYARNVLTKEAPWDVRAYHEANPSFPHNSTADQLYTDQKFEGYRALGEDAGERAVKLLENPPSGHLGAGIERFLKGLP